jgi:hypothetical protein
MRFSILLICFVSFSLSCKIFIIYKRRLCCYQLAGEFYSASCQKEIAAKSPECSEYNFIKQVHQVRIYALKPISRAKVVTFLLNKTVICRDIWIRYYQMVCKIIKTEFVVKNDLNACRFCFQ